MAESGEGALPAPGRSTTEDRILDGRLILRQPRRGHRAGTDAVLLAAAAPQDPGELIVDVGAGVGTAGIAVAWRAPAARLVLVDNDAAAAELARQNLALNGLAERGRVVEADVLNAAARRAGGLARGEASLVLTNPPFFAAGEARASPEPAKASAHLMRKAAEPAAETGLVTWIRASLAMLAPGGCFVIIHRPDALGDMLRAFHHRLGSVRLLPVHPREGADAIRLVVCGIRGSRAGLAVRPALVLHGYDGRFTPAAEAIHRGGALLP